MSENLTQSVSLSRDGDIAIITVDNPPVNALSFHVREGLVKAVDAIGQDDAVKAAVLVCAGKSFISGADIKEFGRPMKDPSLDDALVAIERSTKPIVAAIHGKALGGGLELAMTCQDRVAVADARFGLPEVFLGIIPGAGGTQRLPRLTDLATTIEMAVDGKSIDAETARARGLIGAIVGDLRDGAIAHARKIVAEGAPVPACERDMPERDDELLAATRAKVTKKHRLEPARTAALDLIESGYDMDFPTAVAKAREVSIGLLDSRQSKALRHKFAAERQVARLPDLPEGTKTRDIATVGIVGLGAMGSGIAACFADAGMTVIVKDRDAQDRGAGLAKIAKIYASKVKRRQMDEAEATRRQGMVREAESYDDLAEADLVVEAVSEDMATKRAVFEELGRVTRDGVILASNTSYLDIDELAQASGRPADVCGMHFFNPAHVMKLLENVRGAETSPEVLATITALGKRIGKIPVLSGVCEGFIVNRMLAQRSRETYFMLEEGAKPQQIDAALKEFGFPMGPLALGDLAGIDVQHAARQARIDGFTQREKDADFVDQLFELGRHGQKTGKGWYLYGDDRKPQPDPAVDELLARHAKARGIEQREFTAEEIVQRCVYAMINEGAKILGDEIVSRPQDIDVAMMNGIGFPATTGGPMWLADAIGLQEIRETMRQFADDVGAQYWTPAPLIDTLADEGRGFYSV